MQSRLGALDGNFPAARRPQRRSGRPACLPTTPTTFRIASALPARKCRASQFRAAPIDTRPEDGPDTWWPTAEPPHRINQIYLEPVLFAHLPAMPGARILNGRLVNFTQGLKASPRRSPPRTAERSRYAPKFLVGCDGGRSAGSQGDRRHAVRHVGFSACNRLISARRRCSACAGTGCNPAWATFSLNPVRSGNVYAIDGRKTGWSITI